MYLPCHGGAVRQLVSDPFGIPFGIPFGEWLIRIMHRIFSRRGHRMKLVHAITGTESKYSTVLVLYWYYPSPGIIVPLSAGKRGTIIQGGGWYSNEAT
jgi:hypothetical protein